MADLARQTTEPALVLIHTLEAIVHQSIVIQFVSHQDQLDAILPLEFAIVKMDIMEPSVKIRIAQLLAIMEVLASLTMVPALVHIHSTALIAL